MATLFLMENEGLDVKRDGPSLWITRRGQSGQRVPARYVEEVIVTGNVPMDSDAITLFTANHVPVVFMSRSGRPLGIAQGVERLPSGRRNPLEKRFVRLVRDPSWRERYRNWLAHERSVVQKSAFAILPSHQRERVLLGRWREEIIEDLFRGLAPEWARRDFFWMVLHFFDGLLWDLAMGTVRDAGFDPAIVTLDTAERYGLVEDIRRIFRAEIMKSALRFTRWVHEEKISQLVAGEKRKEWTPLGRRKLVGWFEQDRGRLKEMMRRTVREFEALIWEDPCESRLSGCV